MLSEIKVRILKLKSSQKTSQKSQIKAALEQCQKCLRWKNCQNSEIKNELKNVSKLKQILFYKSNLFLRLPSGSSIDPLSQYAYLRTSSRHSCRQLEGEWKIDMTVWLWKRASPYRCTSPSCGFNQVKMHWLVIRDAFREHRSPISGSRT